MANAPALRNTLPFLTGCVSTAMFVGISRLDAYLGFNQRRSCQGSVITFLACVHSFITS